MKILFKKKYYITFWVSIIIVFMFMVLFHGYYNLQDILKSPSEIWGRSTTLEAEDLFNKQPSIVMDDQYADILVANKNNFTQIRIDRASRQVESKTVTLNGVESYKIQQFRWDRERIFFIEGGNLFFADKQSDGSYNTKTLINENITSFELLHTKHGVIIAASTQDGILLLKQNGRAFEPMGEKYPMKKVGGLSIVQDKKGTYHIASYSDYSDIECQISYITFENAKFTLKSSTIERILSQSWNVNNVQIGIDDRHAYIFYNMTKRDKFGVGAKTQFAYVSLGEEHPQMKFTRFHLFEEDAKSQDSYLNEVRIVNSKDGSVMLTAIKDTYDRKNSNSFSAYLAAIKDGKITDIKRVTANQPFMVNTAIHAYKDEFAFVYLNAAGGFNYEAFYTETGSPYYSNALRPTKEDYEIALMDTIPGYIGSVMLSLINLTLYLPALLWFLIVEFFEIKGLKKRPKLSFGIGFALYLINKLVTFGTYYTPLSMSQMPPPLIFTGAKYFYAISIAVLSVIITKLLKKHKPEMSLITEGIIFALIDIIFTNLLYSTYLI